MALIRYEKVRGEEPSVINRSRRQYVHILGELLASYLCFGSAALKGHRFQKMAVWMFSENLAIKKGAHQLVVA